MNTNSKRNYEVPKNSEKTKKLFFLTEPLVIRIFAKKGQTWSAHTLPKRWIPLVHGPTPKTSQPEGPKTETHWTALVYVCEVLGHRRRCISPLVRGRFCGEARNPQRVDQKRVKNAKLVAIYVPCLEKQGWSSVRAKNSRFSPKNTHTNASAVQHRSKSRPEEGPI